MAGRNDISNEVARQLRILWREYKGDTRPANNAIDRFSHTSVVSAGVIVRNDSGEVVPKFGIMKTSPTGIGTLGDEPFHIITKPDDETARFYLVNGEEEIPIGTPSSPSYGTGYLLNRPGLALYDPESSDEGEPRIGEFWHPGEGSWKLIKDDDEWGFYCIGRLADSGFADTSRFMQQPSLPCLTLRAQLASNMCADAPIGGLVNVRAILENVHRVLPPELPTEAWNDARHAGQAGDDVWMHYDGQRKNSSGSDAPGWYIFDVRGKEAPMTFRIRFNSETCCFEEKLWKIRFESCEDEPSVWSVIENGCGEEC